MLEQGQYQSDDELDEQSSHQFGGQNVSKNEDKLVRNQKIAVAVLVVFGLFTFVLWASQLRNSIKGPFAAYQGDGTSLDDLASTSDTIDLTKDTDSDGIPDVEEANVYKTSAYLPDTDGDSVLDGTEVKNGTDPNRPEGRNCYGSATSTDIISADSQDTSKTTISSTSLNVVVPDLNKVNTVTSSTTDKNLSNLMSGNVSAAELRKILEQSGIDKKTLDAASDEVLMSTLKDTLKNNAK